MKINLFFKSAFILMAAVFLSGCGGKDSSSSIVTEAWVFIGTYTGGDSEGIYLSKMNLETGELSEPSLVAETDNPSFLAIHPDQDFLYAVNESDDFGGNSSGAVSAFVLDPTTGALIFLNQQASQGAHPCHIIVDASGKHVLVANYTGGSVISLPLLADGSLSENATFIQHEGSSVNAARQSSPHAHSINLDSTNSRAFVADLGLDKVLIYDFDAESGALTDPVAGELAPGSGPRHFAMHPSEEYAYVINELLSTVTAFKYDTAAGSLETFQSLSTLPADFEGDNSTSDLQVHPSGKFLYGANRGHDSIVVYAIDQATGELTYVENESTQGSTPRNFGIDPTGKFLLAENQNSNTIVVFSINQETGELDATGHQLNVPSPVCVKFLPIVP